jgi:hypothetical protein
MLYYVPNMRRFSQGNAEYCALVSMQMAQAARGEHFDASLPVPAFVAQFGLPKASLLAMFLNKGYIPVDPTNPNRVYTAAFLREALRRFGPLIACGRIQVTRAAYGHAVVVFGVDTTNNLVLLKDPNSTIPQLGITDQFSDATMITLTAFNAVLARVQLGAYHLVGKPSQGIDLATLAMPTYVMTGDTGRVFEPAAGGGRRSREI